MPTSLNPSNPSSPSGLEIGGDRDNATLISGKAISELPERSSQNVTGNELLVFAEDNQNGSIALHTITDAINGSIEDLSEEMLSALNTEVNALADRIGTLADRTAAAMGVIPNNTSIADELDRLKERTTFLAQQTAANTDSVNALALMKANRAELEQISQSVDQLESDLNTLQGRTTTLASTVSSHAEAIENFGQSILATNHDLYEETRAREAADATMQVDISRLDSSFILLAQNLENEVSAREAAVIAFNNTLNALVSGNASEAIESFNEVIAFLDGVTDDAKLTGLLNELRTRIETEVDERRLACKGNAASILEVEERVDLLTPIALTEDELEAMQSDNSATPGQIYYTPEE